MSIDAWIDARDGETLTRAWSALDMRRVAVGEPTKVWTIGPHGAALAAAAFLGCSPERFAWFAWEPPYEDTRPKPNFQISRTVSRVVLDQVLDFRDAESNEEWQIREVVDGTRGVQHVRVDYYWGEFTRDGSGGGGGSRSVVRLYDRATQRAVSIGLYANEVWMVGEPIDISLLDLHNQLAEFKLRWKVSDPDSLRGFLAMLVADLDAHFDTCPSWPGGADDLVIDDKQYNIRVRVRTYRYESKPFAIEATKHLDADVPDETDSGWSSVTIEGLPWGHEVRGHIDKRDRDVANGSVSLRLPRAQLEATLLRLAAIEQLSAESKR